MKKTMIYLTLVLVMLVWGLNIVVLKVLVQLFPPVTINSLRLLLAAAFLLLVAFWRRKARKFAPWEFRYVCLGALTGVLGHHLFLALGLAFTSAANGGIILGLVPLLTSILALLMLGTPLSFSRWAGIALGFAGVFLIVLSGQGRLNGVSVGDLFMLVSAVSQAFSFIFIKKVSETVNSWWLTGAMQMLGGLLLLSVAPVLEPDGFVQLKEGTVLAWTAFFVSGVVATGIGHMLYNYSIKRIGPGEASIFINLSPFFALLGSALFLQEEILLNQWLSFALVVAGVILGAGMLERRSSTRARSTEMKVVPKSLQKR
ncbi:DMT family transporter [Bacillaceae bacterium]